MTAKIDIMTAAPAAMKPWMAATQAINAGLEPMLVALVEIRASQINGCAGCLDMHTAAARALGETDRRLDLVAAWREAPCYSARERAALAWTEALTRLSEGHGFEAARGALEAQFSAEEQVKLTLVVNVINGWNRLVLGFHGWPEVPARQRAA